MRLAPAEIQAIKAAVFEVFGPEAVVRLFGSRVDDRKRGGDIDLLVETPLGRDTLADEIQCKLALEDRLGERKIDLLLVAPNRPLSGIERIALRDGVLL